jgi:hypothetical protein
MYAIGVSGIANRYVPFAVRVVSNPEISRFAHAELSALPSILTTTVVLIAATVRYTEWLFLPAVANPVVLPGAVNCVNVFVSGSTASAVIGSGFVALIAAPVLSMRTA